MQKPKPHLYYVTLILFHNKSFMAKKIPKNGKDFPLFNKF